MGKFPGGVRSRLPVINYAVVLAIFWTAAVGFFLWLDIRNLRHQSLMLAREQAQAYINKDTAFRFWATSHGGVYVPVDDLTPPSPFLEHVAERDIVTPSGRMLTLMNPSYMLNQVMHEYSDLYGVKSRLVSLTPIRHENTPDQWEESALRKLRDGDGLYAEALREDGPEKDEVLRVMAPIRRTEGCMKCHPNEEELLGSQRGGISLTLPLAPFLGMLEGNERIIFMTHIGVWLLGLLGIAAGAARLRTSETRLMSTEHALMQSEERFRNLVENTGDWIWEVDRDFRFTYVSPQVRDITGFAPDEMLGRRPFTIMRTDDALRTGEELGRLVAEGRPFVALRTEALHRDGRRIVLEASGVPFFDPDGALLGYRGVVRDVTDRTLAEEEILRSRERLARAQEMARLGNWEWDVTSNTITWSDEVYRIFGIARGEFDGTYEGFLSRVHPDDRDPVDKAVRNALDNEEPYSTTHRVVLPDGSKRHVQENAVLIRNSDGEPVRMEGTAMDITPTVNSEMRLRASLREKTLLLQEISHRVKNNMQVVSSLIKLQSSYVEDEHYREVFREMLNRIRSMSMIQDRLYGAEDLTSINVKDYLNSIERTLFMSYDVDASRIRLALECDSASLGIDTAVPFGLLLNELISNCLAHAFPGEVPPGGGEVAVTLRVEEDGTFETCVRDNGIGMAAPPDLGNARSFGTFLVATLAGQIGATVRYDTSGPGTCVYVRFKEAGYSRRI